MLHEKLGDIHAYYKSCKHQWLLYSLCLAHHIYNMSIRKNKTIIKYTIHFKVNLATNKSNILLCNLFHYSKKHVQVNNDLSAPRTFSETVPSLHGIENALHDCFSLLLQNLLLHISRLFMLVPQIPRMN